MQKSYFEKLIKKMLPNTRITITEENGTYTIKLPYEGEILVIYTPENVNSADVIPQAKIKAKVYCSKEDLWKYETKDLPETGFTLTNEKDYFEKIIQQENLDRVWFVASDANDIQKKMKGKV
jgi:hypothetical protein